MAEAIVASTGKEEANEDLLKSALEELPKHMLMFSSSLRELYIQLQMTGDGDTDVQSLNQMEEHVRKQAVVYTKHVLPVVEEAMRRISSFMNYFSDFEYEDWEDCREDAEKDIDEAYCHWKRLKQMHIEMSTSLNEQAQKVKPILEALKRKKDDEQQVGNQSTWSAFKDYGRFVIGRYLSASQSESDSETPQKKEHTTCTTDLCSLVSDKLMPAIENFLKGVVICHSHVATIRKRLIELHREGDTEAEKAYFFEMKKTGELSKISDLCMRFIILADQMRTDLASIPEAPGDKKYADDWLQKLQLKNIGEETGSQFA